MSYIAFAGDRTWRLCGSAAEAWDWLQEVGGGRVYREVSLTSFDGWIVVEDKGNGLLLQSPAGAWRRVWND